MIGASGIGTLVRVALLGPVRERNKLMTVNADPIRADLPVSDLVTRARKGEQHAWDALVERYSPLVWSICRRYRLDDAGAVAVGKRVFLHLVEQLGGICDPAALPGWLASTTRRECCWALRKARGPQAAGSAPDIADIPGQQGDTGEDELLVTGRHAALRAAFADLPPSCQQLLALLIADPPASSAEISAKLGIPGDSIASARSRCLDKLRSHPAVAAMINTGTERAEGETDSQAAGPGL